MTPPEDDVMVGDLVPGDVLMVTAQPRNDWAKLILALDGAEGRFSHCGIALGDGCILSSRPFPPPLWRPLDLGGLIGEKLDHFWDLDQRVHRIQVDPTKRAAAAARLCQYEARAGSFSMSKIVAIAATLHALDPGRDRELAPKAQARIVRRAMAFARAWCARDFFCAEFVATLYQWSFTVEDLVPPDTRARPRVPRTGRIVSDIAPAAIAPWLTEDKRKTLHALVYDVRRYDREFFGPARVDLLLEDMGRFFGIDGRPDEIDDSPLKGYEALPWVLVTPRMVLSKHLGNGPPPLVRRRRSAS